MTSLPQPNGLATLSFNVSSSLKKFGPRVGSLKLSRSQDSVSIQTPALVTWTSRGVVPHLSRDHHRRTNCIRWVHVPFESFLDHSPPVPTLQSGSNPLHTFLGYSESQHILSMSLRDPSDDSEMPPNGSEYVSARCVRGVRKVTRSDWRSYVLDCRPDVVIALSDSPFTKPPYSQKRLTKSIERSIAWLADILRPIETICTPSLSHPENMPSPNVLVHMAGGASPAARTAFANELMEVLHGKEAENIKPLKCLDDGVTGYVFDLVPLRYSLAADESIDSPSLPEIPIPITRYSDHLLPLLEASLTPLPPHKLRVINSTISPHEILRLILHIGIDFFDAHWAQKAANIGVALDFRFPVSDQILTNSETGGKKIRKSKRSDLGLNLFDQVYAHDFSKLSDSFLDGLSASKHPCPSHETLVCQCAACSPVASAYHPNTSPNSTSVSNADQSSPPVAKFLPPFTRAYIHHLLHTHEMSSHSLLTMHNLEVLDSFFAGVQTVLALPDGISRFPTEVENFIKMYDEEMLVFEEARVSWHEVEMARGKGRLARAKETEANLASEVEQ